MLKLILLMILSFISIFLANAQAAARLQHFTIKRLGGGDLTAVVKETRSGIIINVKRCQFREVRNLSTLVHDEAIHRDARAILAGKAIIAVDETPKDPRPVPTGTWQRVEFSYNTAQFSDEDVEGEMKTKEVSAPIIIIDNKVSDVISKLEQAARELCPKEL